MSAQTPQVPPPVTLPKVPQPSQKPPQQQEEEEQTPEDSGDAEEAQQIDQEADQSIPKNEPNPFKLPDIDKILQSEFNDDLWKLLKGGLPCLENSAVCLAQLQEKAIAQSPLLKEMDARIGEANERIAQAQARNRRSIQLSIFTPGLQYLLGPTPQAGQAQSQGNGLIDNVLKIIRGDTGLINGLLNVVGVPFLQGTQGGNADAQRSAIAIGDLQIKVAELQRGRASLADLTKKEVALSLSKFDELRVGYQTQQIVLTRSVQRFKVYELRYIRGNSTTEDYLLKQNQLDNEKAQGYRAWASMRREIFNLKLLCLGVKEAEN
ncbi:hypothetical protein [Cylindrospermum stagnale]|uniref:hypothetical protein n=1 Tax=Cylindrospermum stagnale TaxID=142864 RepID=UPI001FE1815C|nr:hypothetical protein [Cylindrospermum stagnale]